MFFRLAFKMCVCCRGRFRVHQVIQARMPEGRRVGPVLVRRRNISNSLKFRFLVDSVCLVVPVSILKDHWRTKLPLWLYDFLNRLFRLWTLKFDVFRTLLATFAMPTKQATCMNGCTIFARCQGIENKQTALCLDNDGKRFSLFSKKHIFTQLSQLLVNSESWSLCIMQS